MVVEIVGMDIRNGSEARHPEWGENPKEKKSHFVLSLGDIIMRGTYAEVRAAFIAKEVAK